MSRKRHLNFLGRIILRVTPKGVIELLDHSPEVTKLFQSKSIKDKSHKKTL